MPTINLGRNCTISVDGSPLTSVRSVTVNVQRAEIECPLFFGGETVCFPGTRSVSLDVECIGHEDAATLTAAIGDTDQPVTVSGSHVGGDFYVFSLSASEPLDDVVTYTATLKRSLR